MVLETIEIQVQADVKKIFDEADTSTLFYHNYLHTEGVVKRIGAIGAYLPKEELVLLRIAGWFHDIAYLTAYPNHEERSMVVAEYYLKEKSVSDVQVQMVVDCIEATKLAMKPRTEWEKIIKDADIGYGVTEDFFETGPQLRKEWEVHLNHFYSDTEWEKLQCNFLKGVEFYTEYAQMNYQPILALNIQKQFEKQNKG